MLKNSDTHSFPKQCILSQATEFQSIFQSGKKIKTRFFTLLVKPNQLSYGRLGLVVAKKSVRLAVDRNLIKRVVRESFRHQQLTGMDTLFVVHPAINSLNKTDLREFLDKQWPLLISLGKS